MTDTTTTTTARLAAAEYHAREAAELRTRGRRVEAAQHEETVRSLMALPAAEQMIEEGRLALRRQIAAEVWGPVRT